MYLTIDSDCLEKLFRKCFNWEIYNGFILVLVTKQSINREYFFIYTKYPLSICDPETPKQVL